LRSADAEGMCMMNLFERMKLRAMLRNCNYELAATVLKQQYYEEGKNTELNRLIDALIEAPNFDTALKIIEYNEMYVFYFTESCHDGLYVRKQPKEPPRSRRAAAAQAPLEPQQADALPEVPSGAPHGDVPDEKPSPSPASLIEERFAELEAAVAREANAVREMSRVSDAGTAGLSGKERNPYEEPNRRTTFREADPGPSATAVKEERPKVTISERSAVREARAAADAAGKDTLKESIKESIKKLVRDVSGEAEVSPAAAKMPEPEPDVPADAAHETETIDPERSRYRNVISTLLIDIEEMKRQREEYQQYIFNNAPDAVKYKRWIVSLDEAIEEFTGAARILSRYRKK
jgi:hypothetical protein